MQTSIAKGIYKMQELAALAVSFPLTTITETSAGNPLKAGRKTADGKEAQADWNSVTLTTESGEKLLINGLELAKQALADDELRDTVFGAKGLKGSYAGSVLTIEKCEFKSEFSLALANRKFSC